MTIHLPCVVVLGLQFAFAAIMPSVAYADGECPAGYHQQGEQDEHQGHTTITHAVCAPDEDEKPPAAPVPAIAMSCATARQRASQLRSSIDKQRGLSEANQDQREEWTRAGTAGRNKLVKDSVTLVLGAYAADSEVIQEEAKNLRCWPRPWMSASKR